MRMEFFILKRTFVRIQQGHMFLFGDYEIRIYAGQFVEIIYEDRSGSITQRKIAVREVRDGMITLTVISLGHLGQITYLRGHRSVNQLRR